MSSSQASHEALKRRVLGQHKQSTKTKGMPKPSTLASYVGVFLLIITLVAIGYQPPKKADGTVASIAASPSAAATDQPSIDSIVANRVAGDIAERTNLPVMANIAERSTSLSVKNELAQTSDVTIVKPQIVQSNTRSTIVSYTVKRGENLQSVADRFGVSTTTLKWANDLTSDSVKTGKKLTIPPVDGVVYTVRSGDTVKSVAKHFSANEQRIVSFNSLEINGLKKGSKIIIPDGVVPTNERPGYVTPVLPSQSSSSYGVDTYSASFMAGSVGNRYAYGYCTWWAYEKRAGAGHPVGSFWGNAYSWNDAAASQGFRVDHTPEAGAVLQTDGGGGGYGHVAYVESVDSKGNVHLSEMNYAGWNVVSTRTIPADQAGIYNYIH